MKSTKNKIFSFVRRTKDIQKRFFVQNDETEENKRPTISSYFLKFFQAMTLWENEGLWSDAIEGIIRYSKCPSIALYFSRYPKTIHNERKSRLKNTEKVYMLFLQSCNYLIKMDVNFMLNTYFKINEEKQHMKVNQLESITTQLESIQFMEGLNKIIRERPNTKHEKVLFVVKKAISYISAVKENKIMELSLVNKEFHKCLFKKIVKQFLKIEILDKKKRVFIWTLIAKTGTISNSTYSSNKKLIKSN
jgi:hypothetical protein